MTELQLSKKKVGQLILILLAGSVDFSFEKTSKYQLPTGLAEGPHSEKRKVSKMNSQKLPLGAQFEYYNRSPQKR